MFSELIHRFRVWRLERQAERLRQDELADLAGLNGKIRESDAMRRLMARFEMNTATAIACFEQKE